jgi:hypothetical protein
MQRPRGANDHAGPVRRGLVEVLSEVHVCSRSATTTAPIPSRSWCLPSSP